MSTDFPRLIEDAFPLKQTSLDSVFERIVRLGCISTPRIWPAQWRLQVQDPFEILLATMKNSILISARQILAKATEA